ncbi:MAG: presqualene diphosphate synthase HpnD [Vicinamibacterales bacterium]|nr:presqualene diphosphate synthase HpnD [Vicinamibacterales bacterium]
MEDPRLDGWPSGRGLITVARDTSFSYSFLVLPPSGRRAIGAVWDFCRAVDDAVDEAAGGAGPLSAEAQAVAGRELALWRAEVARAFEGGTPETPQGRALVPHIRAFGLPRTPFEDLIDGVEMDLHAPRYETFDALVEYCRRVASAVGLMCLPIFGAREPGSRDYAHHLGLALQLTNIIRDVGVDLAQGRLYLPLEDLRRFGCTEPMLAAGRVTPEVRALLAFQCRRARDYYTRAAAAAPAADRRRLVAAGIMGGIYFGILERIERAGYDVFTERIRVPRPARARIALAVWMRTMLGLPPRPHA